MHGCKHASKCRGIHAHPRPWQESVYRGVLLAALITCGSVPRCRWFTPPALTTTTHVLNACRGLQLAAERGEPGEVRERACHAANATRWQALAGLHAVAANNPFLAVQRHTHTRVRCQRVLARSSTFRPCLGTCSFLQLCVVRGMAVADADPSLQVYFVTAGEVLGTRDFFTRYAQVWGSRWEYLA